VADRPGYYSTNTLQEAAEIPSPTGIHFRYNRKQSTVHVVTGIIFE
jgi:hypothetical protein